MSISRQKPKQVSHSEIQRWQRHLKQCDTLKNKLGSVSSRLVIIRLITFLVLVTLLVSPSDRQLYFGVFGNWLVALVTGAFIYLIITHKKIQTRKKYFEFLREHHYKAIKRRKREWSNLNAHSNTEKTDDIFKDLAVTGEQASLKNLFGMISCSDAWQNWQQWLKQPIDDDLIKTRQEAVAELTGIRPTILRFLHASSKYELTDTVRNDLKNWLGSAQSHDAMHLIFLFSILSVLAFWGGILGYAFEVLPLWVCIAGGLANGIITFMTFGKTDQLFKRTEGLQPIIASMKSRIKVVQNCDFTNGHLKTLHQPLVAKHNKTIESLGSIERLSMLAELRHYGLVYMLAQITLLWNIHVYTGISNWHRKHRKHLLHSYQCLSELETLTGVACFALENPEFCYPNQDKSNQQIKLQNLGHPLLSVYDRINNDLIWTNQKPMLLISGSNMAGKSTFMKAVGLNVLLSRLGAPVCADSACWPKMKVKTVIKVEDSLANGDSYFMAELKRLVSITKNSANVHDLTFTLCLFDEIMSGTNSHDRTEIFKAIVNALKQQNTFAIFSTHDMKLAEFAQSDDHFDLFQFAEQYIKNNSQYTMDFDYQLKPGICQQTNAQTLLSVLGLDD